LSIKFYKEICPHYTDVPANETPGNIDETGGHWLELNTSYQYTEANPLTDIPAACHTASGRTFDLRRGSTLTAYQTATTGSDGTVTVYLGPADIPLARSDYGYLDR